MLFSMLLISIMCTKFHDAQLNSLRMKAKKQTYFRIYNITKDEDYFFGFISYYYYRAI